VGTAPCRTSRTRSSRPHEGVAARRTHGTHRSAGRCPPA
jgi:hypothetical protein